MAIDEDIMPDRMLYILFCMAKEYIQTGKVSEETYAKCIGKEPKEVKLSQVGEWSKDPKEWKKEDREDDNGREI